MLEALTVMITFSGVNADENSAVVIDVERVSQPINPPVSVFY